MLRINRTRANGMLLKAMFNHIMFELICLLRPFLLQKTKHVLSKFEVLLGGCKKLPLEF